MTRAGLAALAGLTTLAACGGDTPDPCAGATGTCLTVTVSSEEVDRLDVLELDVLYGTFHDTITTQAEGATELPVITALRLDIPATVPEIAAVVVAAKLGGVVRGTGWASKALPPGGTERVEFTLAPPPAPADDCVAGAFYCGGDKLAGDPGVLYKCNAGGVPLARGRCALECVVNVGNDDACRGVNKPCVEGGRYCGGNKLDGDPQSLYQCVGGVGRNRLECANGCEIKPPGQDDACR